MLLTDNVEVFITRPSRNHDYRTEYLFSRAATAASQSYIAVNDGEEYSVAIVFGKNFEITPPIVDPSFDHRVSACYVKVEIDNGLALQQRVFRLPDTEKRPKVQDFKVFDRAASGGVARCSLQFASIPKGTIASDSSQLLER